MDTILAVDLGKFNSVVCLYDPATTQHSFITVQTTPQAIRDLLSRYGEWEITDPAVPEDLE